MAACETWAEFHRLDEQFHLRLARATGIGTAAEELRMALRALYRYYLPYPLEYLLESNSEHHELIESLRHHDAVNAVHIVREHVGVLHRTMFVGLLAAESPPPVQ
jgi:DNA-binding GntR family transcriptional regulator